MAKLNLIQRLFWSSEKIQKYFLENSKNNRDDLTLLIEAHKNTINEQANRIIEKDSIIKELKEKIIREEVVSKNASDQTRELKQKIINYENKRTELESALNSTKIQKDELSREINNKLKTLNRIETTFFGRTGNKGKGVLGELQLSNLLEASGLSKEFYINNLQVNSKVVEFAIKSGIEGKWIPVDSKVLDVDLDEEQTIIITNAYKNKVRTAAKDITKYLSKANTADYGLLVLQSDDIYMKLYKHDPAFFQEIIRNQKVYISAPSSFIQYASSLSHILDIYAKVHNEEKLYEDIISLMQTTAKFATSMKKTYSNFNTAMNSHYPALEKKHDKVNKKLIDEGKVKSIESLD